MVPTGTVLFGKHSTGPWEQSNPGKARDQRQAQFQGNRPLQKAIWTKGQTSILRNSEALKQIPNKAQKAQKRLKFR